MFLAKLGVSTSSKECPSGNSSQEPVEQAIPQRALTSSKGIP